MNVILKTAGKVLKVDASQIDPQDDVQDYGFTSIAITEFCNHFNETFQLDLSPAIFFDLASPTINGLLDYLYAEHKDEFVSYFKIQMKGEC